MCDTKAAQISTFGVVLGLLLAAGIVLAVVPQINQYSNFMGCLIDRWPVLEACGLHAIWCAPDEFISVLQLFGQWAICAPLFFVYLAYHPGDQEDDGGQTDSTAQWSAEEGHLSEEGEAEQCEEKVACDGDASSTDTAAATPGAAPPVSYAFAKRVVGTFFVFAVVTAVLAGVLLTQDECGSAARSYAKVLGYLCVAMVVLQYTPQIMLTYQTGSAGSLSITMVAIQAPGSILFTIVQITQGNSIAIWMGTCIASVELLVLLGMLIYFDCRQRQQSEVEGQEHLLHPPSA